MMVRASFDHALNDDAVLVIYEYDWHAPAYAELLAVMYQGVDVLPILNPEDFEYLRGLLTENAYEAKVVEAESAVEAKWDARRDEPTYHAA